LTNILSAISGQFSKSLVLGTFMPVVVFVILNLLFVVPLFPSNPVIVTQLLAFDVQGVVATLFISIVLTGLLYNLNIPVIRLYEGYPWKDSFVGKWRVRHFQAQMAESIRLHNRAQIFRGALRPRNIEELRHRPDEAGNSVTEEARREKVGRIKQLRASLGRSINTEFPISTASILPTSLGNVIRSFEDYPQRQYQMAAITLWPRLIAKIDKDYAASIDDAKTSLDFMINSSVLSMSTALILIFVGLIYPTPLALPRLWVPWALKIFLFTALSYVTYLWSISRAAAWGDLVKGAFDLYRWELLKQLGFKRTPASLSEERELWGQISRQLIYGDPFKDHLLSYETPTTNASGTPATVGLEIGRGVTTNGTDSSFRVHVRVKNVDGQKRTAQNVVVTDTLPDGFYLVWGSAFVSHEDAVAAHEQGLASGACRPQGNVLNDPEERVEVLGVNPYKFVIGQIDYGKSVLLGYDAVVRKERRP
jgi:hypothetical protein